MKLRLHQLRFYGMLSTCLCLAAGAAAVADGGSVFDLSLEKLAAVVVTDTKVPQSRDTVTQRLETIRSGDFELLTTPQGNLAELLRMTAGQFVNPLSRNDANWGSYAGLGPKYNTYILDGLPIDSFADAMSLDPWALQEVEIHKGPASVLYPNYLSMDFAGNEMSLAGITNFILKDKINYESTRVAAGYGSYNTSSARFFHQNRKDNISYFVGGSYEHSDYVNYGTVDSWLSMLQTPEYKKSKLYAKVSYAAPDDSQKLSLFVHRTDHTGNTGRPNREFGNRYETVNLEFSQTLDEAWNVQIKSGYRNYDRSWEEDNFPASLSLRERDGVRQKIYPSDLTLTYQHSGGSILTMGADLQIASYKTYLVVNDVEAKSQGLFMQEKVVLDRWILRVGGRANRTNHSYDVVNSITPLLREKSWDSLLWSTGARFKASSQLWLYCNVGSSFVVPSAKSVCGTIEASDAGQPGKNGQLPNADLKPERGTGSDLGLEVHPDASLSLGVRSFLNRIDDAIVDNVVSATPSQSRSINAGRVSSYGFEITLEKSLSKDFRIFANFTRTSSETKNAADPDQNGTQIPFVPAFVSNAGFSLKLPFDVMFSPCFQSVGNYYDTTSKTGRRRFGSYELLDLKIHGSLAQKSGYSVSYSLDLNNLLNRRFDMPWQFRNPGFNTFVSLEISF